VYFSIILIKFSTALAVFLCIRKRHEAGKRTYIATITTQVIVYCDSGIAKTVEIRVQFRNTVAELAAAYPNPLIFATLFVMASNVDLSSGSGDIQFCAMRLNSSGISVTLEI
jgi:hypothetical protein